MTKVQSILEKLENTNSQKEKIEILKTMNEVQKRWFSLCYNSLITFGVKKIPEYTSESNNLDIISIMDILEKEFVTREITGNAAIERLRDILSNAEEPEVVERLIKRDARCSVNSTLLNKVFPNLIPEIPCMLAQPMNEKTLKNIKFPAISQLKADGMRCIAFITSNNVRMFSRNGTEIICEPLKNTLMTIGQIEENLLSDNVTLMLDGELICYKDNKLLDRKTSNGICNKVLKGTANKEELDLIHMQLWDIVKVDSNTFNPLEDRPYEKRLDDLYNILLNMIIFSKLEVIPTEVVNSMEEALEHFQKMLSQGLEGTILKNQDAKWSNTRSKDLVKLKEENTIDLLVVDIEEGSGDFEGGLGAIICETSDKKLRVRVGTGFSFEDRGFVNDLSNGKKVVKQIKSLEEVSKNYLGKIVEVKYNQIIKSKGKDEMSLFLPRLVCIRNDKDTANSIDEI